ncbi:MULTISPECIES: hypothetical protein [unclassified Bradyrhizobium]
MIRRNGASCQDAFQEALLERFGRRMRSQQSLYTDGNRAGAAAGEVL